MSNGRINLPGDWYMIRNDDAESPYHLDWFLSNPEGIWVARFWDGSETGESDCREFFKALYGIKAGEVTEEDIAWAKDVMKEMR